MNQISMKTNKVSDALLGLAIGDAIGVPYEFLSREAMTENPARDMIGYGTHNQAPGTWSDDASLTFCLAESLTKGYDLKDIAQRFIDWNYEAHWSARSEVFDIGITTSKSIRRLFTLLKEGKEKELKNLRFDADEYDNGNGSLMRILPLLFFIKGKTLNEQFEIIWDVSALTHRHIRSAISCLIYLRMAEYLLEGKDKEKAYQLTRTDIQVFWKESNLAEAEKEHFSRVIQADIRDTEVEKIRTSGYVIHSLEASFWFFLKKENYRDTILSIINMGDDTDTSAAIVGGLAGLYYGEKQFPADWIQALARLDDIRLLCMNLEEVYL